MCAATATERRFLLDPLIDAPLIGPRVLQLVGEQQGAALWRTFGPAAFRQRRGYPVEWVPYEELRKVNVAAFDLLVFCRLSYFPEHRAGMRRNFGRLRHAGLRLVFECDDDLFTPFSEEQILRRPDRETSAHQLRVESDNARWMVRQVDGGTVSTQDLATLGRRFTDVPVEVVPNAIDTDTFTAIQAAVPRPVVGRTVGWAGGGRPGADLEPMAEAWGRIARTHPEVTVIRSEKPRV